MKRITNIAILGSTGSIGRSSLEVIERLSDRFRVTCLTAHRNTDLLLEQIERFRPRLVVTGTEEAGDRLRGLVHGPTEIRTGEDGLLEAVERDDVDLVISSLVGFAGLVPTLHAIRAGKHIALANKETLVVGGELVMNEARSNNVRLLPIDSEHSAILQCLQGEDLRSVERLILTASGGPFLHTSKDEFSRITPERALRHPTWQMGNKITIDSATLMNKGLEVIEAHWLFGLPHERINVVVHPQSIIHSMVEFVDGSIKAQLGVPDMKLPIQYALTYPERPAATFTRLDLARLGQLTFLEPDRDRFPCLELAFRALRSGGTMPAVLNAANEVAVQLFLEGRVPFTAVPAIIAGAMEAHTPVEQPDLDTLIRIDAQTRESVFHHHSALTIG